MSISSTAQADVGRPPIVINDDGTTTVDRPPVEAGPFLKPDLVELTQIDPTILLDIRYATTDNFTGLQVYTQPRAFLQRPAAEALKRINARLRNQGYGILVYDGYRPWSVTKKFWDITPQSQKDFVADPANGSRHNRGCAVDVTLYDIKTSQPVEMSTDYDEFTERAYPDYAGASDMAKKHRLILKEAMETEGFSIYPYEWWHFDYKDFKLYPIMDVTFEALGAELK